MEIKVSI